MKTYINLIIVTLLLAVSAGLAKAAPGTTYWSRPLILVNDGYWLGVQIGGDQVLITLDDKLSGLRLSNAPYYYSARLASDTTDIHGLTNPVADISGRTLTIRGKIAGLDVEQTYNLPRNRPIMEERFVVRNNTGTQVNLSDFQAGFVHPLTDLSGIVVPELAADRFVAVPFRIKPDEGNGTTYDFSTSDLITTKGYDLHVRVEQQADRVPADRRESEGWAWTHGAYTLGISKFDQDNMQWSVLALDHQASATYLRFGGVAIVDGEPSYLGRTAPGASVKLGVTRFQTVHGGYQEAMYAFRDFLDENNCRFPKAFNPPVHWEQLYDMNGAWDDRLHRYTKAILENEARKGVAYSCEALYLDPGWDTGFATFLWGTDWLGSRKDFVSEMQSKYGLKVSLHTPLAPWMSVGWPMGPGTAPATYPASALRKPASAPDRPELFVPILDNGRRNLALLPDAKANASSVFSNGANPKHQIAHLNDGRYGNDSSWIADAATGWAEIDMGAAYSISSVRLSNDESGQYADRAPVDYRVMVATQYDTNPDSANWTTVAKVTGESLLGTRDFTFPACQARWVRVQIDKSDQGQPRLDEIQIYEAQPASSADIALWTAIPHRSPTPKLGASTICMGSKAYLDEASQRLLDNCADGVTFLMFDGSWYQGGCDDPTHGHPVPFTKEDHMRACLDLAQRVHAKYPNVLIEMHDMLMGGCPVRATPVYYKYGLPGSYDDNWGFEMMWDPMQNIQSGQARALYYYNLSCNVPIYLHIDLRRDTPGCAELWWYASTCRHLGIGGTHSDPAVVAAQQAAMRTYHQYERFYKRGDFYGIDEDIHIHALPQENAFVVNLFNLTDHAQVVSGSIPLSRLGIKSSRLATSTDDVGRLDQAGIWSIHRDVKPWSCQVVFVQVVSP